MRSEDIYKEAADQERQADEQQATGELPGRGAMPRHAAGTPGSGELTEADEAPGGPEMPEASEPRRDGEMPQAGGMRQEREMPGEVAMQGAGEVRAAGDLPRAGGMPGEAGMARGDGMSGDGPRELFGDGDLERFQVRWREVQSRFVDDPGEAVRGADRLVAEVMGELSEMLSQRKHDLEEQWRRGGGAETEELRQALRRYRAFFDQLLHV